MLGRGAVMSSPPQPQPETLRISLKRLEDMNLSELRQEWARLYHAPVPQALRRNMLKAAIAYKLQLDIWGDLPRAIEHELERLVRRTGHHFQSGEEPSQKPYARFNSTIANLKPGTRLFRIWRERTYEVEVLDDGYRWEGGSYRSLSKIAREITGTRWNGLLFFGIRRPDDTKRVQSR